MQARLGNYKNIDFEGLLRFYGRDLSSFLNTARMEVQMPSCPHCQAGYELLQPIPFPAALYRLGTGENHSWNGMGGFGRPITQAIAEEFGVEPTTRNVGAVVRAVSPGGAAVRQIVQRLRALTERAH